MSRLVAILFVILALPMLGGEADIETAIRKAYAYRYSSAEYRHLSGMRHRKAAQFVLLDVDGETVDIDSYNAQWEALIKKQMKVSWEGKILEFEASNSRRITCLVEEKLISVEGDRMGKMTRPVSFETRSKDTWELIEGTWLQTRSELVQQSTRRGQFSPLAK